ncbi:MAG: TIGR02449 family protein [Gammaproteobacteria bacterium]
MGPYVSNPYAKINVVAALTVRRQRLYSDAMHTENPRELLELELKRLECRVAELVALCARLRGETHSLRDRLETLSAERAGLLARNEQVRGKVEAMILRLKSLEESA